MRNGSVYVIILSYNNADDLINTIESFSRQKYDNLHLVLSDNGSVDDCIERVRKNYPRITVLDNKKNLGWSGGNNVGIDFALNQNADYILLSNNDIELEDPATITKLVKNMEIFANCGVKIIGTRVNYMHSKNVIHNDGWIMFPKEEGKGIIFNKARQQCKFETPPGIRIVDSVDGSFILIKADIFSEIGKLDESLFMYADEIEFSYRAWQRGYISLVDTSLRIFHKINETGKRNSPFSMYYRIRNLFYIQKKHRTSIDNYFFRVNIRYVFKNLVKVIVRPKEFSGKRARVFFAILRGFFDGYIFNRMGKRF